MPSDKLDRLPASRRRSLVVNAAREFASAGYDAASLNRVLAECGMSKSSFYYVLSSKRELFELVVRELSRSVLDRVEIPAPGDFARERFWPAVDALLARLGSLAADDEDFRLLGRMFYLSGAPGDPVAGAMAAIGEWLAGVLAVGRATGAVRDDLPAPLQARLVFAVLRTMDEWGVENAAATEADVLAVRAVLARLIGPEMV
ncbi:TetR/AcrR family transcriptional regulator [Amycolatopsis suaedae]|uniref:TetR/AcrR family transcriptional regulator n=1 Tax=Amycolatopsis suaedae TaxID=2510978 RepID=UPI0013EEFD67|nr:TetR/AcrR family transcriptional regulator [Amycolatopsis suaedae]